MPSPLELTIALQLVDNATKNLLKTKESIEKVSSKLEQVKNNGNFTRLNNSTNKLIKNFKKLHQTIKEAFDPKNIDEFSEKLEDFTVKKAAIAASTFAGLHSTISAFSNLQQAQVEMEIAFMEKGGNLPKELEEIKKIANELGTKLPGSTEDFYKLAQALKEQGLAIKTIKNGALEASAYLGALFKVQYNEAGEMAAKFQEAFGVADKNLVKFIDQLQKFKFAFGQNLNDIKYAVQYIGSSLQTLGIKGLENSKKVFAWMGILGSMSIEGSIAGTAIQSALQGILKFKEISKATKGELAEIRRLFLEKDIDIKLFDESGNFLGLENFFSQITQLSKLTNEEMMIVVKKIFGDVGSRAILPLLLKTKKTYEEQKGYLDLLLKQGVITQEKYNQLLQQAKEGKLNTAIEEAVQKMEQQASLQERISKQLSTTKAKWEALTGTIYNIQAQIGALFSPIINTTLDTLNNIAGVISSFIEKHQTLSKLLIMPVFALGGLAIALSTLALAGGLALKYLSFLTETIKPLEAIYKKLFIRTIELNSGYTTQTKQVNILKEKLNQLKQISLKDILDKTKQLAVKTFEISKTTFTTFINSLKKVPAHINKITLYTYTWTKANLFTIAGLKRLSLMIFSNLTNAVKTAILAFRALTLTMLTSPIFWIGAIFTAAALLIFKYWKPIVNFFKGIFIGIKQALTPIIPAVKETANAFKPLLSLFSPITNLAKAIYSLIKPVDDTGNAALNMGIKFGKAIGKIIALIIKIPLYLLKLPFEMFKAGQKIVESITNGIKSGISKIVNTMKNLGQKIRNFLPFSPAKEGPLKDIHLTGIRLIQTIAQGIKEDPLIAKINTVLTKAKGLLNLSPIGFLTKQITNIIAPKPIKPTPTTTSKKADIKITINPTININGNTDKKTAELIAVRTSEEIEKTLNKILEEKMRLSYGL